MVRHCPAKELEERPSDARSVHTDPGTCNRKRRCQRMKPPARKSKVPRRPHALGARERHVTAAEAKRLAARYLANKTFKSLTVLDGESLRWNIFNVRRRNTWLV